MHLYSTLLCIVVHPKHITIMWVGGSLLNHQQCAASTWMMRRLPQDNGDSAFTTHQLQVERRESHRANQGDGDYWEAMIDKGQWREFGQDTGVTHSLFMRRAMEFLMTTESQELGLTSVRPGSIDPMTAVVQRVKAFCVLQSFLFHDTTRLNGTLFLIYFISLFHLTP